MSSLGGNSGFSEYVIDVPAKINLWLQIVDRRADGYHNLWTLMVPVSVFDRMIIRFVGGGSIALHCNHPDVPEDSRNLVWKAVSVYKDRTGWPDGGVTVNIEKNIPVGAGLGGGSSNAGGILRLFNLINPSPLSEAELVNVAKRVGADVPFFLRCRPALAEGIGDRLTYVKGVPQYFVVLVKPPFAISTKAAYRSLELTKKGNFISLNEILDLNVDLSSILKNDLEGYALSRYPMLVEIKRWLVEQGALASLVTGSGPTVFGIFEGRGRAERVFEAARSKWDRGFWLRLAEVLSNPGWPFSEV